MWIGEIDMQYIQSYFTDIGIKRRTNQDGLMLLKADTDFDQILLAVICDGMGGHQLGELASKTIIRKFEAWFKLEFPFLLYNGLNFELLRENWDRLIRECNQLLVSYGEQHRIELGSTLTAFLFTDNRYYAAHVGDSRGYEISSDQIIQLTEDHSLLADAIRKGHMTWQEAQRDKRKNILLECVGITKSIHIDFYTGEIKKNHAYILCTDGFWHKITRKELMHYLSGNQFKDNKMLRMHLNYLVEQVKQRRERDNISVIGVVPV